MINGGHVLFNIDTDTSRPQQNGRHSADDIFKSQLLNFKWYFIKMRFLYTNWQYNSIGLGNGSPDRRQAIVCSNDCPVYWRIFALPGVHVLSHWQKTVNVLDIVKWKEYLFHELISCQVG